MTLASPVAPMDSISMRIASTWACLMPNPTCCTRSSGAMMPISPTRVAASLQLLPSPSELVPLFDHPISLPISGLDALTDSHRHYQHSYSRESSSGAGSPPVAIWGSSLLIHQTSHRYNPVPLSNQKSSKVSLLEQGTPDTVSASVALTCDHPHSHKSYCHPGPVNKALD